MRGITVLVATAGGFTCKVLFAPTVGIPEEEGIEEGNDEVCGAENDGIDVNEVVDAETIATDIFCEDGWDTVHNDAIVVLLDTECGVTFELGIAAAEDVFVVELLL